VEIQKKAVEVHDFHRFVCFGINAAVAVAAVSDAAI
jgi:hypothetical protein